jgi:hypothetical protein
LSRLVVATDHVIPARCDAVVMAELDSPLGAENGLIKESHTPKGLYIARTLIREERVVPIGVLNATSRDQTLTK